MKNFLKFLAAVSILFGMIYTTPGMANNCAGYEGFIHQVAAITGQHPHEVALQYLHSSSHCAQKAALAYLNMHNGSMPQHYLQQSIQSMPYNAGDLYAYLASQFTPQQIAWAKQLGYLK